MKHKLERSFLIWTSKPELFKALQTHLNQSEWQVKFIDGTKVLDELAGDAANITCLAALQPLSNCSGEDIRRIIRFVDSGHPLFVAGGQNDDSDPYKLSSLSKLVAKFGIEFNDDCIIRPNPYKHHHPKVAMLEDFVANRGLNQWLGKHLKLRQLNLDDAPGDEVLVVGANNQGLKACGPRLLYPNGCSMKVGKPAIVMMTSSQWALPSKQAICAIHQDSKSQRIVALGSSDLLSDKYINEEDNLAIVKSLIDFIGVDEFPINTSDAKTLEIPEAIVGPDIEKLVDIPITCLQDIDPLPEDRMSLIDRKLFSLDTTSKLHLVIKAHQDLDVEYKPLGLIKPKLPVKHLKFEPAIHSFILRRRISDDSH